MKKVLLINSPLFREKNASYNEDALPPIGLAYIATALKDSGAQVELIDAVACNMPLDELMPAIKAINPDYLAINVFTTNLEIVRSIVESIDDSSIHIIVGGLSTRTLYETIFLWDTSNHIDVVFGDGELIAPDIINDSLKEEPLVSEANRRYFKNDSQSSYFVNDISSVRLDRSYLSHEPIYHPRGFYEAHIITSRGCVFNCAFCSAARSLNKDLSIREKSIDSIIYELREIESNNRIVTSIRVLDDLFLKTERVF